MTGSARARKSLGTPSDDDMRKSGIRSLDLPNLSVAFIEMFHFDRDSKIHPSHTKSVCECSTHYREIPEYSAYLIAFDFPFWTNNLHGQCDLGDHCNLSRGSQQWKKIWKTDASLWTDPGALKSTRIDTDGGSNPVWNEKLQVPLTRSFIHRRGSSIAIEIYCKTMLGNKRVGCAEIPFSDIVDGYGTALNSSHFLSYRLKTPKGKPRGTIDLSVRLLQYSPSLPSPRPPKLGNSQPDFVSNPCNPQTPTLQNANYTDGRHRYDQNGAAFGGSSCAIGVPISVGQPFHWPYRPWQSQVQGSHGNVNYYSPVPTSIYPPSYAR